MTPGITYIIAQRGLNITDSAYILKLLRTFMTIQSHIITRISLGLMNEYEGAEKYTGNIYRELYHQSGNSTSS